MRSGQGRHPISGGLIHLHTHPPTQYTHSLEETHLRSTYILRGGDKYLRQSTKTCGPVGRTSMTIRGRSNKGGGKDRSAKIGTKEDPEACLWPASAVEPAKIIGDAEFPAADVGEKCPTIPEVRDTSLGRVWRYPGLLAKSGAHLQPDVEAIESQHDYT